MRHVSEILPVVISELIYRHNTQLTDRQREYADFMFAFFEENDQMPTYQILAEHFNCYPNTAACHVAALVRKGVLARNSLGKLKRGPAFPVRRFG